MTKTRGALLGTTAKTQYRIQLELQEGRTATFTYSDRSMAREHYLQLTALGAVGGYAIRSHEFGEVDDRPHSSRVHKPN